MTKTDKIFELIKQEEKRQSTTLMMIPSENYTYPEVRRALGSVLTHKYAEGQPGRRYYQGNEIVDQVEELCQELALKAFGLDPKKWSANVQAHSGSPANLAVYNAVLTPGDKIMAMNLVDGGHLSHGWHTPQKKLTLVSKIYKVAFYPINANTQTFDYKEVEKSVLKYKPKMLITGGTAYPRNIDYKRMSQIAKKAGAYYLADIAHEAGLIAAGANPSPFPWADFVTMTTQKTLRGPRGAIIISKKEFESAINSSIIPGMQGGPHMHTIAGIAISLEKSMSKEFRSYATQTVKNAQALAAELEKSGLKIISGGTDKHLVLVDLRTVGTNGWIVAWALEAAGIIANRNTVPGETASPFYPSGLRLGTPALTVRGMKEKEMKQIAKWIAEVIFYINDQKLPEDKEKRDIFTKNFPENVIKDKKLRAIRKEVTALCSKFPLKLA